MKNSSIVNIVKGENSIIHMFDMKNSSIVHMFKGNNSIIIHIFKVKRRLQCFT